jgi:hypothetical protein
VVLAFLRTGERLAERGNGVRCGMAHRGAA